MMQKGKYVPALSLHWLTQFYDALVEGPMSALKMRQGMLRSMGDLSGRSVLDVGCGTGTFAMLLKRAHPDAEVSGLDGDAKILDLARSKAAELGLDIRFTEAMSFAMPYPDQSFDFVVTSLMLHHLGGEAKQQTMAEMFRVLKPGGQVIGLDFAEPSGAVGRGLRPLTRHFERIAENLDGLLPVMFDKAGFRDYSEINRYVLGSIALFRSTRPQERRART